MIGLVIALYFLLIGDLRFAAAQRSRTLCVDVIVLYFLIDRRSAESFTRESYRAFCREAIAFVLNKYLVYYP